MGKHSLQRQQTGHLEVYILQRYRRGLLLFDPDQLLQVDLALVHAFDVWCQLLRVLGAEIGCFQDFLLWVDDAGVQFCCLAVFTDEHPVARLKVLPALLGVLRVRNLAFSLHCDDERCSLAEGALCFDRPAHLLNDALAYREAQARSLLIPSGILL